MDEIRFNSGACSIWDYDTPNTDENFTFLYLAPFTPCYIYHFHYYIIYFGVKAFELVKEKKFGTMAIHKNGKLEDIAIKEVIDQYNKVDLSHNLIHTAKGVGISFGD